MDDVLALSTGAWVVCYAGLFFGTILQRLSGQGFGMIAAPLMVMAAPTYVPTTLLLLGLVVGFGAMAVDRSQIAKHELWPGFGGRILGSITAAWIALHYSDPKVLAVIVAVVVYIAVALSLLGLSVRISPTSLSCAGFVAGIMGTLTAMGAPPMALLYQHEPQRRSAAMQNAFFGFGMVVSLLALSVAGLVGLRHLIAAVILLPPTLLGLWLSQKIAPKVEKTAIRPYALSFATMAATILLANRFLF